MTNSSISGMKLVESTLMVDSITVQARRNHQKRINKKWLKRYGYRIITIPKTDVYVMNDMIVGHPKIIRKMAELIGRQGGNGC